MIVFLKKVRINTIFSAFEPVITEPLELCYLKSLLNNMNIENYIVDELFNLNEPHDLIPTVIVLTGYNVSEDKIKKDAIHYKLKYPNVIIVVGGVHIQGNSHLFNTAGIDYVCHTQSLSAFKTLMENISNNDSRLIDGIDVFNSSSSCWMASNKKIVHESENVLPDRSLFYQFKNKLRYLEKQKVALIKGSIGCPYNCSYCYCKLLNNGNYIKADYEKITCEMENIEADYFWIVDDVLFAGRNDALEFIDIIKRKRIKVKIIGYLRADFILREKDLLPLLREAGLVEIIVGFEAVTNDELKSYEKTTNAIDYPEIISLLKENQIDLTALFMVKPDYEIHDFRNLYRFIKNNNIGVFTISILTPIKGTRDYELMRDKLTTINPEKYDFLHLVLRPKLPRWLYYLMFYGIHIRLLKSKRVWKYLIKR